VVKVYNTYRLLDSVTREMIRAKIWAMNREKEQYIAQTAGQGDNSARGLGQTIVNSTLLVTTMLVTTHNQRNEVTL
jgi:hypothetical protein